MSAVKALTGVSALVTLHPSEHSGAVNAHQRTLSHAVGQQRRERIVQKAVSMILPAGNNDIAVKCLVSFGYSSVRHRCQQGLCRKSYALLSRRHACDNNR